MFHFTPASSTRTHPASNASSIVDGKDWAATALGERESWPASLRSAFAICQGAITPTAVLWGPELVVLYNDAFATRLADRHPAALGAPAREAFADDWDTVGPMLEHTLDTGEATSASDQLDDSTRGGAREARYYDYAFSAIPGDNGTLDGIFVICSECTASVEADRSVDDTERRFQQMIDALPAAIYTTDAEGRLTHFNPAAIELSGRVPQLGTDRWCVSWKLYHPDGSPMPHGTCPMAVALRGDRVAQGIEAIAERPDGEQVWVRAFPTPLHDDSGKLIGGINMLLDVTERRRTELLLREQTQLLEIIAAGRPLDECLAAICDAVQRLHPHARAVIELADEPGAAIELGGHSYQASPVLDVNGSTVGSFALCFDQEHEPDEWAKLLGDFGTRMAGIALEHDRWGKALRESENEFRSLFDSIDQGFCVLEKLDTAAGERSDYLNLVANPAFERQSGVSDAVGKTILDTLPDLEEHWVHILDEVVESGEAVSYEAHIEPLDRILEVHVFPTGQPEQKRVAMLFNDVTERQQAARALGEADRAKDEFLAMLGHELRNPLSPMVTALELMRLRGPDVLVKERTVIERQVQRVVSLVDDLLDVSRITRGLVELERTPVEIAEIIAEAIETVDPLLQQREQTICTEVTPGLMVAGDARRLVQIVVNLLTNAAKYSPPGLRIDVSARADGDDVDLRVRDQGIGIDPRVLPQVFELFAQGSQRIDRAEGGLGLGLAIVKNLVTLHGGSVEARSEGRDRGSEFIVRLPLCARAPRLVDEPKGGVRAPATNLRRVLIVDDNVDAAESLSELLGAVGYQTRVAHDGAEALDAASDFEPDLALVDIGLPVLDGYEVARRLRADPKLHRLPLIAVTGYGQSSDRQRALDAGFQEHVVKPIDPARLNELVERFTSRGGGTREHRLHH